MLLAFGAGGFLFNTGGMPLPFAAAAVMAVLALVVMKLFLHESKNPVLPEDGGNDAGEAADKPSGAGYPSKKRSLTAVLLSLMFYPLLFVAKGDGEATGGNSF